MSADAKPDLRLEIAHVLFIDIVGYSKLLINEQGESLHELNEVVRATETFRSAEAAGKLTKIPTGDGMALVFSTALDAPVQCALEISKALKSRPDLRVRMGVHSGPVSAVTDVNNRTNIAGGGINMAQRVMDCGDAGHILLSKRVAEDLAQYRQWQPTLHDLGECQVKHDVTVSVVNLYTDDAGNAAVPAKFANTSSVADAVPAAKPKSPSKIPLIAGSVVALLIVGGAIWFFTMAGKDRGAVRQNSEERRSAREAHLARAENLYRGYYAMIAAWVGEKDLACEQLVTATRMNGTLSYGQLKLLPYWDPLRGDPRFEKIVQSLAPK